MTPASSQAAFRLRMPAVKLSMVSTRPNACSAKNVTTPAERERVYGQWDHVRAYGRDFVDRLSESGFDVTVDTFAYSLTQDLVRKEGLSREDIYICRKHATS